MSRIAVNGFDFHGWGYEKIGAFLKAREIEQFELQYEMGNDESLGSAAPILADYGVTIGCIYTGSRWALAHAEQAERAAAVLDECITLAAEVGAPFVQFYPGTILGPDSYGAIRLLADRLARPLERSRTAGVTLIFENLFDIKDNDPQSRDMARGADSTRILLDLVGSAQLKLNYDPCNFYIAGVEPWPYAYEVLKEHIAYVHLKDVARYCEWLHGPRAQNRVYRDHEREYIFTPLGTGALNYDGIISGLRRDGYNGPMALEALTVPERQAESFDRSLAYLRRLLSEEQ
jgi:sugar phosphate isomerase/epimerase